MTHFNTEVNTKATQQSFSIDKRIITTYGSPIGPYGIGVYTVLSCLADKLGICSPLVGQIAKIIGARKAMIRKIFRVLQPHDLIDVVASYNQNGRQQSNHYHLFPIGLNQKRKQNSRTKESPCCL